VRSGCTGKGSCGKDCVDFEKTFEFVRSSDMDGAQDTVDTDIALGVVQMRNQPGGQRQESREILLVKCIKYMVDSTLDVLWEEYGA